VVWAVSVKAAGLVISSERETLMMDLHRREWAAKVKLIHAIAKSQGTLSRILDSVADVAAHDSPNNELAKKLVGNIQVLSECIVSYGDRKIVHSAQ